MSLWFYLSKCIDFAPILTVSSTALLLRLYVDPVFCTHCSPFMCHGSTIIWYSAIWGIFQLKLLISHSIELNTVILIRPICTFVPGLFRPKVWIVLWRLLICIHCLYFKIRNVNVTRHKNTGPTSHKTHSVPVKHITDKLMIFKNNGCSYRESLNTHNIHTHKNT